MSSSDRLHRMPDRVAEAGVRRSPDQTVCAAAGRMPRAAYSCYIVPPAMHPTMMLGILTQPLDIGCCQEVLRTSSL